MPACPVALNRGPVRLFLLSWAGYLRLWTRDLENSGSGGHNFDYRPSREIPLGGGHHEQNHANPALCALPCFGFASFFLWGKGGDAQVILKMPNKHELSVGQTIKVAIEIDFARFFNETTTKAILPEDNEYEEIEVTKSLDKDNVTIIETKKRRFPFFHKKKKDEEKK
jgi:hypothetical protein